MTPRRYPDRSTVVAPEPQERRADAADQGPGTTCRSPRRGSAGNGSGPAQAENGSTRPTSVTLCPPPPAGTRTLTLPILSVGDEHHEDIRINLGNDGTWSISSGPTAWTGQDAAPAISDTCGPEHITRERFAAVQFGMGFDDAIAAVGCRGELVAEGMDGDAHVKAYHFEHGDSNFDLWFKDGTVASKRQTIQ